MSELLASPFGCLSFAERRSSAAELIAPHDDTTTSAVSSIVSPSFVAMTLVTRRPLASVTSASTLVFVISATLRGSTAGSMAQTSASDCPLIRDGNPSHDLQQ